MNEVTFAPMAGWGAAFEAAAKRLKCFTRQELMQSVGSIRRPSTDAAKEWLRRQIDAGALVRLRGRRSIAYYKLNAKTEQQEGGNRD